MSNVRWRIVGEEVVSCDCAWGCPCQFNALPTNGRCEAIAAFEIRQGHYGNVTLDGVRFVRIYSWPASIPEGNGTRLTIVDDRASADQRAAPKNTAPGSFFPMGLNTRKRRSATRLASRSRRRGN